MAGLSAATRSVGAGIGAGAAVLALAGIAIAAVVVPGYDVQDVPQVSTSVWVIRDDGQYARVNTDLHEFDAVNSAADPSAVVQDGDRGILFTQGLVQSWALDPTSPEDFVSGDGGPDDGASGALASPAGTINVSSLGDYVLYLTSFGEVHLGAFPAVGAIAVNPTKLDPFADIVRVEGEDPSSYVADAAAIGPNGRVVMFSGSEGSVREYDATQGSFRESETPVPDAPPAGTVLSMVIVGGHWVIYSAADSLLWIEGLDGPVSTTMGAEALLQKSTSSEAFALLANAQGLESISILDGTITPLAEASGTPAAPTVVDGVAYAAWLDTASGSLWSSQTQQVQVLEVERGLLDDVRAVQPTFRDNGRRALLTETSTGMVWTLPDAQLIPTSAWQQIDSRQELEGVVQVDDVAEQEPPVATDDTFGVRRGATVVLPVLLNDSDPNKRDVLTIAADSVSGIADASFGSVGLAQADQQLVMTVSASSGSTTFTYEASDGQAHSQPATVTITVVPDEQNTAPEWCPMEGCTQQRPTPQVAPGGYTKVAALSGWVDAEGDAIALADARAADPEAPITVVPTADGEVVIRHLDPNGGDGTYGIIISVMDTSGATTDLEFELRVTASPTLTAKPAVLVATAGKPTVLSIADWVSGGSGSYRLVDASATVGGGLSVSPSPATGTAELLANAPGDYLASYTVEDTQTLTQQSAVVRVTVPEPDRTMTAVPLTAFVRPGEDTTVDVLSAVSSTSGHVLMVRDATGSSPNLSVGVVNQTHLRLSATTTAVPAGPIGYANVTIADTAGSVVTTQVSVFLIQSSHGVGPVAAPDSVSVRAGEQVDIRVLDNDASPRGERLVLSNEVEGSGVEGELAFGSGSVVRYLAPQVPGVYTLTYSTHLESDGARADSAEVTVRVLAPGSNREPQPTALVARVSAGQTVSIPVATSSIDPDGDSVVVTDVSQPGSGFGVASVGSSGDTIRYSAPATGVPGGEASFEYTVRDSSGATATGTVRVGVLTVDFDVAPVTYTDRVAVALGSTTPVVMSPLLNDFDPARGELELIDVAPNAVPGSAEYSRLEGLIDGSTSLEDGTVVFHAGDVEGPASFTYTVQSLATYSTSQGLIVLSVSEDPSRDGMVIRDTVLTAENRRDLPTGIDVVTGRVEWSAGDASALTLKIWGEAAARYSVNGWSISGPVPDAGDLVPFSLTGIDSTGTEVVNYGFLRVPAFQDLRIQLKRNLPPVSVGEDDTVEFSVREMLRIAPADVIEVRQDESFTAQRSNAVCTPSGGDKVTYAAGREAPWTDTCSVAVRLQGQELWSIVAVPLSVEPKDPQARLSAISLTIAPGESGTVDILDEMVSWEGGRVGDLSSIHLTTEYEGSSFVVTPTGDSVSIQALASAQPGTKETLLVESGAYGGLRSAITLVVGVALPDAPRGATFSHSCDVSDGASCLIAVVGLPSEYDPYANKPGAGLALTSVGTGDSVTCDVATVTRVSNTHVQATWPSGSKPRGGECVVDFTVADAQGRTGVGRLTINVNGYPPPPQSVDTVAFSDTSVTLRVELADAALTHPEVTSVELLEGGGVAPQSTCVANGTQSYLCTVSGLVNGEQHTYTARSINAVGDSLDSSAETTWAYAAPTISAVSAETLYDAALTTQTQGVVTLEVESSDDTSAFQVLRDDTLVTTLPRTGATSVQNVVLDVGVANLRLIPISRFAPPLTGENTGLAEYTTVIVAGAPTFAGPPSATVGTPTTTAVFTEQVVEANFSDLPLSNVYVMWTDPTAPSCTMVEGVATVGNRSDVVTSTDTTITGLTPNRDYFVGQCGANGFGAAWTQASETVFTWTPPSAPTGSDLTYTVATTPTWHEYLATFDLVSEPSIDPEPGFSIVYFRDGFPLGSSFTLNPDSDAQMSAAYCSDAHPDLCGDQVNLDPASGTPATTVIVAFPTECVADAPSTTDVTISFAARGSAEVTLEFDGYLVSWLSDSYADLEPLEFPYDICP